MGGSIALLFMDDGKLCMMDDRLVGRSKSAYLSICALETKIYDYARLQCPSLALLDVQNALHCISSERAVQIKNKEHEADCLRLPITSCGEAILRAHLSSRSRHRRSFLYHSN